MYKLLIIGLIVIAISFLPFRNRPVSSPTAPYPSPTPSSTITPSEITTGYRPFSPGLLDSVTTKRRVLFFYASWCPTCRPVDTELSSQANMIPPDLTIIRINYNDPETDDEETALATQYGITYQHTFVQINEDGEAIARWNGGGLAKIVESLE